MATKKQSKSAFIRSQPSLLSAAEVVAKGKAAGVTILPGLVYEVRRTAKLKKGAAKKSTAKKTKTVPNRSVSKKPAQTKADFVRKFPNLSPKEVVAKAKLEGVKLDTGYVYNVRGADKLAQPSITTASSSKAENLLKAVAAEVGLGRAIQLLEAERARVHSILRG
jgi:hypothetical protein